jgi:hypothetical protein
VKLLKKLFTIDALLERKRNERIAAVLLRKRQALISSAMKKKETKASTV